MKIRTARKVLRTLNRPMSRDYKWTLADIAVECSRSFRKLRRKAVVTRHGRFVDELMEWAMKRYM